MTTATKKSVQAKGANNWEADRPDRDERERKEGWVPQ